MNEQVCLWCSTKHKDGTKIKQKHEKLLRKVASGELPCNVGQCKLHLCTRFQSIFRLGLEKFGNCNEALAELNRVNHFLEKLSEWNIH